MYEHQFVTPEEPRALVAELRRLLEQCPAEGLRLIDECEPVIDLLWPEWQTPLERTGIGRDAFQEIVIGYRNELRLWVMGERPWTHCVEGLIGRIERRARSES